MRRIILTAILVCLLVGTARAVDLATAFGVAGLPTNVQFNTCQFQAVHAGSTSLGEVTIAANGSDSATITLVCNGISVTTSLPSISVNGHQVNSVSFPQTVTSSAAGVWRMIVGPLTFTVTAQ
jgi:hypothetical protein